MANIANVAIMGLIFGMIGTTIGGICGAFLNIHTNKYVSFILEVAAGLMTAVICFNLIPESMEYSGITGTILGVIIGVFVMVICNEFVNKRLAKKYGFNTSNKNNLLKAGIIIGIGLAIHNFPEGLAIGTGFDVSNELGLSLAIAICIHDFPERYCNGSSIKTGWL